MEDPNTPKLRWEPWNPSRCPPSSCNGLCVSGADVGVPVTGAGVAYAHPCCPKHGEPHIFQWNGKTHQTHSGPVRWCECGAYEDEHGPVRGEILCSDWGSNVSPDREDDERNMRAARRQIELFMEDEKRERLTVALALLGASVEARREAWFDFTEQRGQ